MPRRSTESSLADRDVEGLRGRYRVNLKVRPHFKYMGAAFELSPVGSLDQE